MDRFTPQQLTRMLDALAARLALAGERMELVVIGGAALTILGFVDRPPRDVDIVARIEEGVLVPARPLPAALVEARDLVAADFEASDGWLNAGPSDLLTFGLPEGFVERLESRELGPGLVVHFASRLDQIHFKLYAFVDQGLGRHEEDLRALDPTHAELEAAGIWTRTQDPSEGFQQELIGALRYLGVEDADVGA